METKTDNQVDTLINIIIRFVGAFFGSWLFGTVLGLSSAATAGRFDQIGFLWAILGAVILFGLI